MAPKRAHFFNGLLLFIAFSLSAQAGSYLSTTIFLVLKSVKILPTMLIASLWLRKRFSLLDWVAGLVSALGMGLCLEVKVGMDTDMRWRWLGAICMVWALVFDGASANAQEAIMRQYKAPPEELALYSYGVASFASVIYGMTYGDIQSGVVRVASDSQLAFLFLVYASASCGATACTLDLIGDFGASSFMFISALSKALVTMASILVELREEGATVSAPQLAGITLVFAAAGLAAFARSRTEESLQQDPEKEGIGLSTPTTTAANMYKNPLPVESASTSATPPTSPSRASGHCDREGRLLKTENSDDLMAPIKIPPDSGSCVVPHIGVTPRTWGMELGEHSSNTEGGLNSKIRRRRPNGNIGHSGERKNKEGVDRPETGRPTTPLSLPRTPLASSSPTLPFRETLSTALTLVSSATLGIHRPLPVKEVLSPVAISRSRSSSLQQ